MKNKNPEKRHYVRVGASVLTSYKIINASKEKESEIAAKNISGDGIKIPSKKRLEPGTLLEITLNFLNENKTITLKAKVIWINSNNNNKKYPYEIGLKFVNISSAQRTELSNYVQYLDREGLLKNL